MALARCILGKFLGPPLDVPTFSARCLHVQRQIWPRIRIPRNSKDLLHAANLRHGTDGFTSPPKEGVLRIFSPLKIRRLRPGLKPRTWVPKASTLPLDHLAKPKLMNKSPNKKINASRNKKINIKSKLTMNKLNSLATYCSDPCKCTA